MYRFGWGLWIERERLMPDEKAGVGQHPKARQTLQRMGSSDKSGSFLVFLGFLLEYHPETSWLELLRLLPPLPLDLSAAFVVVSGLFSVRSK